MFPLLIGFILCTGVILFAGTRLSFYSDVIAEKTKLGRTWIGLVLVASITSLPEFINSIGAVTYAGVPDIAAGDLIGSCVFNLLIIALLDLSYPKRPLLSEAKTSHIISGGLGIIQLAVVIGGLSLDKNIPRFGWIGLNSIIFVFIYFFSLGLTFQYEQKINQENDQQKCELYSNITLNKAFILLIINAIFVIGAALILPKIGAGIAEITGLGQTFVGNIFIALSTSLPELIVSLGALRCKAIDLAFGNLMGSTIFNIAILGIIDFFYIKNSILLAVNQKHIISVISAIVMTSVVIISLTYRAEKKYLPLSIDGVILVVIYILNIICLYLTR
ncbi:MAG: sodium:calcium antiporter [candidate division WOR-3 bacterium]